MPRKMQIVSKRPRSEKFDIGMTPAQYREIEAAVGTGRIQTELGLRPRILYRYARGEVPIRQVVAYALRALADRRNV